MRQLPETLLLRVSDRISEQMGLSFSKSRLRDLEIGLNSAFKAFDFKDPLSCAEWLLSTPLTRPQMEILASYFTVGETRFMREKHNLQILKEMIIPEVIRAGEKLNHRHLRIWSAGCCSGEEAYSFAIVARESMPEDWKISVLGTDINSEFLNKARKGQYTNWSFRHTSDLFKQTYFTKELGTDRYQIHTKIKDMVEFSYLNLNEDIYPSLLNHTTALNIISCSNVLMYFRPDRVEKVLNRFFEALVPGGWLLLSAVEIFSSYLKKFETIQTADTTVFRKPLTKTKLFKEKSSQKDETQENRPPQPSSSNSTSQVSVPLESLSNLAQKYANEGKLLEAKQTCYQAINSSHPRSRDHFLMAMIHQECGETEAAILSLQRALFLEPELVVAHFTLGNLKRLQGLEQESKKHFKNASKLLKKLSPDEIIPESDGITAVRLIEIIERNLG